MSSGLFSEDTERGDEEGEHPSDLGSEVLQAIAEGAKFRIRRLRRDPSSNRVLWTLGPTYTADDVPGGPLGDHALAVRRAVRGEPGEYVVEVVAPSPADDGRMRWRRVTRWRRSVTIEDERPPATVEAMRERLAALTLQAEIEQRQAEIERARKERMGDREALEARLEAKLEALSRRLEQPRVDWPALIGALAPVIAKLLDRSPEVSVMQAMAPIMGLREREEARLTREVIRALLDMQRPQSEPDAEPAPWDRVVGLIERLPFMRSGEERQPPNGSPTPPGRAAPPAKPRKLEPRTMIDHVVLELSRARKRGLSPNDAADEVARRWPADRWPHDLLEAVAEPREEDRVQAVSRVVQRHLTPPLALLVTRIAASPEGRQWFEQASSRYFVAALEVADMPPDSPENETEKVEPPDEETSEPESRDAEEPAVDSADA